MLAQNCLRYMGMLFKRCSWRLFEGVSAEATASLLHAPAKLTSLNVPYNNRRMLILQRALRWVLQMAALASGNLARQATRSL